MLDEFLKIPLVGFCLLNLGGCNWLSQRNLPVTQFTASNLGVIINEADPLSVQIGDYYQRQRQIPSRNIIKISFPPNQTNLPVEVFKTLKTKVDAQTPNNVQGYALTWAAPYRVDCMSVTSAFALGFDPKYCANGCQPTATSPYFNRQTLHPYQDLKIRPTMMLAATSFEQAKKLIDRGISSDESAPSGTAYLVNTDDKARSVRSQFYEKIQNVLGKYFAIEILNTNALANKNDVMFYFTGLVAVDKLDTLRFRPGAIADHLTSTGGQLTDSGQMSSLKWLEAGATGSYGTAIEPCNFVQKFPHPGIVMQAYLQGNTLLESYWKSVAWPGQGVFIGEPLAHPFGQTKP